MTKKCLAPYVHSLHTLSTVRGTGDALVPSGGMDRASRRGEEEGMAKSAKRKGDEGLTPTVRAAQAGDPRAFEELVERFRGPLASYATALLRDRGHAEDAVQDTFLQAWTRLRMLRDPSAFRPWLYATLERAAFSNSRSRRRKSTLSLLEESTVAEGAPTEEGDAAVAARPEILALRSALAALPPPYREVLVMHYVDELSAREVGDAVGLSFNNAKVRLYRARIALRRELAARGVTTAAGIPGAEEEAGEGREIEDGSGREVLEVAEEAAGDENLEVAKVVAAGELVS